MVQLLRRSVQKPAREQKARDKTEAGDGLRRLFSRGEQCERVERCERERARLAGCVVLHARGALVVGAHLALVHGRARSRGRRIGCAAAAELLVELLAGTVLLAPAAELLQARALIGGFVLRLAAISGTLVGLVEVDEGLPGMGAPATARRGAGRFDAGTAVGVRGNGGPRRGGGEIIDDRTRPGRISEGSRARCGAGDARGIREGPRGRVTGRGARAPGRAHRCGNALLHAAGRAPPRGPQRRIDRRAPCARIAFHLVKRKYIRLVAQWSALLLASWFVDGGCNARSLLKDTTEAGAPPPDAGAQPAR